MVKEYCRCEKAAAYNAAAAFDANLEEIIPRRESMVELAEERCQAVEEPVMIMRHRIGLSGFFLIIGFVAWIVWVLISGANSQYSLEFSSPYIITPVVLLLGAISGGYLRRCWQRGELILLFVVLLIVTAIAIPIYANASAAVGGLFIVLAGLAMLDLREAMKSRQLSWGTTELPQLNTEYRGRQFFLRSLSVSEFCW